MVQLENQKSKLKTKIRWLLKGLILAAILWLIFVLMTRALQHIALTQIAELTKTRIEARSVDFDLNGSVFIEKLAIRPRRVAGRGRPGREHKYDDAILKAETIYARFGIGSLLLLRPRLKEIRVNDFVFNAISDLDTGRWNLSALKIKPLKGGSGKMPIIRLKNGTLQYSKVSNGRLKVVAQVPLDAKFGPAEQTRDAYSFDITTAKTAADSGKSVLTGLWRLAPPLSKGRGRGNITITGGISLADIPVLERAWTINTLAAELNYDQGNTYSLKLKAKDLLGEHLDSRFSSSTSIQHLHSPKDSTRTPIGGASSIEDASDSRVLLEKFGLVAALQRFFRRYRPTGRVDIDLEASGNLDRLSESTLRGKVNCKNVSICDRKFAYTVEHIVGPVDFTEKGASLNNLSGEHRNVKLLFNGFTRNFGQDRKYEIRITSNNMALDNELYDALSPERKKFWSAFSPSGLAAIDYRRSRRSQTDKKTTLAVALLNIEAAYNRFPYPLKNLTGKLFFTSDGITLSDLVSQLNERKITLNGKVTEHNTDRPIYDISIEANNIPLDSTLTASLPARQRRFYDRFDMTGLANADIKIFTPEQNVGPTTFIADVYFKETSLKIKQSPLTLSTISAKAVFTPDLIRIQKLTGRYGQGLVSLTGQIWPADGAEQLRYRLLLHTERTELNEDLFGLLPAPLEKLVAELQPVGKINLTADLNNTGGADYPDYRIAVDCLGNSVNFEPFPYTLKDITGRLMITTDTIAFEGFTATVANGLQIPPDTSTIKINGQIALAYNASGSGRLKPSAGDIVLTAETLRIKGKSLTNLKADVYYDRRLQSWLTKNLIADCYGGRLTGKCELKQPTDVPWEYLLQMGFDNIDLKQFLSDARPGETNCDSHTSGKMSGSLSVSAAVGGTLSRIGRCRLRITDMQVGKLSPMAKLLHVLKLTETKDFAFERMLVDSYIKNDRIFIKQLDLSGEAIAFNGSGQVDMQSQNVDLTLTARGRRLATAEPSVLQSLTEGLGQGVVRMDITGNVYDPQVTTTTLPVIKGTLQILGTKPTTP